MIAKVLKVYGGQGEVSQFFIFYFSSFPPTFENVFAIELW